ncbi:hypothetical protein V1291_005309 [Nitrobacteraceae bacterium AZCC 1564]
MGQFKEHPYANTNWRFGGPLVSELEPYLPPARNDYVHDGLVSDGGLLGSAVGGAAGARLGAQAGAIAGSYGGPVGAAAGLFLGGALGYLGGAHAGHLGVRGAEVIGGILKNPSSYDVDQQGNPIGPSAFPGQPATDSKEPAGSPFESARKAVPFVPYPSNAIQHGAFVGADV